MEKTNELTEKDFNEFLSAAGEEQFRILLAHAQKNEERIQIKAAENPKTNEVKGKGKGKT